MDLQCNAKWQVERSRQFSALEDDMSSEHGGNGLSPCVSRRKNALGTLIGDSVGNSELLPKIGTTIKGIEIYFYS